MLGNCLTCGKEFKFSPSQKRKYCSQICAVGVGNVIRWKDKKSVKLLCIVCGVEFSVRPSRAGKAKYCDYKCHQIGEGRKGGEVRGDQLKEIAERKPPEQRKSYPKFKGRHCHRIEAEKKIRRPLLPGEVVHHKDENRQNFSQDNLEVLPSQSEHVKIHFLGMMKKRKQIHAGH